MKSRRSVRDRGRHRAAPRRGVLLLVVLSMLVLFLLVGTTFLISSGQYRSAARTVAQAKRTTFQPADLLERALMQLVRDTNNRSSVIRHHSLLRDLYGVDGFTGRVYSRSRAFGESNDVPAAPRFAGVDPNNDPAPFRGPSDGQIVEIYVEDYADRALGTATEAPTLEQFYDPNIGLPIVGLGYDQAGVPVEHRLSPVDGYYEGCVLTMTSGPCRGQSVRVLDYEHIRTYVPNGTPTATVVEARLRVVAPTRADGTPLNPAANGTLLEFIEDVGPDRPLGHSFIVNGRPLNGAGVGYNVLSLAHDLTGGYPEPRLSAVEAVRDAESGEAFELVEVALTPNSVLFDAIRGYAGASGPPNDRRFNVFARSPVAPNDPNEARILSRLFADGPASGVEDNRLLYRDFAGPGDTDESYDAADFQNLFLALQSPEPRARGRVGSAVQRRRRSDVGRATTTGRCDRRGAERTSTSTA